MKCTSCDICGHVDMINNIEINIVSDNNEHRIFSQITSTKYRKFDICGNCFDLFKRLMHDISLTQVEPEYKGMVPDENR